ncbi:MAG: MBL fold metallo-hydrolase [Pseudomonadota bacterium]|jgi:glyoxylase-like metal-dependent hydrolase (beta-lactamase superfamily II)
MQFGRYSVSLVVFGAFRLDGGSMFGSVPKTLWNKSIPADIDNCIPLVCRSLLLEDDSRKILVDVGTGDKWNDKLRQIYAIDTTPVRELSFDPLEITDVVLTHLHFDHAGGISHITSDGELALTYPRAKVHLQLANWERANNPTPKDRASYLLENIAPLRSADLQLYDGTLEILPDLKVHRVDGHTPGQQWIEIGNCSSESNPRLFFPTDLIPTSHHVPLPFHMGYDVCADTLLREKLSFLERATALNATVCFQHDRDTALARIGRNPKGGFEVLV